MWASPEGRSQRLDSIGVKVNDTTPETSTATPIVTENSRKSLPTSPPMKRIGMNTAASETVMETMVKPISRAPSRVAWNLDLPISMCRTMFSSMTMASSTTNPTDKVRAMRLRLSRL